MKIMLLLGLLGHALCAVADCLLAYTPNGRFQFSEAKDYERMARRFEGMPLKPLELSIALGTVALCLAAFGYAAVSDWMLPYSGVAAAILRASGMVFTVAITAHHACCGAVEWFFVRMGRTEEALDGAMAFFKRTSLPMVVGYLGLLTFAATFLFMVAAGRTGLPRWACLFNTLPLFLALTPTKLPAKGNIANAAMFLGLLFLLG